MEHLTKVVEITNLQWESLTNNVYKMAMTPEVELNEVEWRKNLVPCPLK